MFFEKNGSVLEKIELFIILTYVAIEDGIVYPYKRDKVSEGRHLIILEQQRTKFDILYKKKKYNAVGHSKSIDSSDRSKKTLVKPRKNG